MAASHAALWLRAINPFLRPRGMMEAMRASRALCLGLLVSLAGSVPATLWMMQSDYLQQTMAAQNAVVGLDPEALAMQQAVMEGLMPMVMVAGLVFSLILYGGLVWAQWRYMTRAIPIVMLVFSAYGIVSNVLVRTTGLYPIPNLPVELTILTWVVFALSTMTYVASLRARLFCTILRVNPKHSSRRAA